ncbi:MULTISPECIES: DUF2637 domain-containing protein [Mycobacterium]|uniref:DUF2637 domain-containing protein n=1 Tax=Mycobacterium TaxID=1763 RepID=UPI00069C131D|nr:MULTISPECIES: DUF2637 domain-containing protein [Mycobacterium]ORB82229.1 hypothetical protein B1T44_29370 [Mycobacterium persicum]VAZ69637.1 hypothetical protein LAUMK40_05800 [Mycobacterium kansasii]
MEASIQRYPWAVLAIRAAAVSLAVFVGVASFFLSFTALADVAVRSHVPPSQAWLWPCTVDGATLLATLGAVVCMSEHRARRFFWAVLIGGLLVSVGGNDLHAVLPPQQELPWMLRAAVGAVAPIAVVVSIHGLTILMRVPRPSSAADQRATPAGQQSVRPRDVPAPTRESVTATATAADRPGLHEGVAPAPTATPPIRDHTDADKGSVLPYVDLADKVLGIITVKDIDREEIANVLRMSYEHNLPNRDIGRRLTLRHHTVGKIIDASAQVLRNESLAKVC